MFETLTFTERRHLCRVLLGASRDCLTERDYLHRDPRAVAYPGQKISAYTGLIDEVQDLADDVLAIDNVPATRIGPPDA